MVLIIDDDINIRELNQDLVELLGYPSLLASGGVEGIKLFNKHQNDIILVLLDLKMPDINGKDTFIELKKINNCVKVIIATGYVNNEEINELLELGIKNILYKPYSVDKFKQIITKALDEN